MKKQAACNNKHALYTPLNDSKWLVITDGQKGIMDRYRHPQFFLLSLLPRGQGSSEGDTFCFLIYFKLELEDIIKAELQVLPCLKWAICMSKYLWILGDDFSKGFKLPPGKITFWIFFTVCFTRIACLLPWRFVKWMCPAEISRDVARSFVTALGNLSAEMHQV